MALAAVALCCAPSAAGSIFYAPHEPAAARGMWWAAGVPAPLITLKNGGVAGGVAG